MHVLPGKVRGVFVPHTFFFKNFRPRANCPSWFPHSAACMQKQSKEQKPRHAPLPCEKAACVHHCLFLAALGLHCTLAFSSCSGQGASHCGGFSCCAAQALYTWVSEAAAHRLCSAVHRLSCSKACGVFPDLGSNLCSLHWQADSLLLSHQGSPQQYFFKKNLATNREDMSSILDPGGSPTSQGN